MGSDGFFNPLHSAFLPCAVGAITSRNRQAHRVKTGLHIVIGYRQNDIDNGK